jgi:hypothetical protein
LRRPGRLRRFFARAQERSKAGKLALEFAMLQFQQFEAPLDLRRVLCAVGH